MDVFLEDIGESCVDTNEVSDTIIAEESEQLYESESEETEDSIWTIAYRGVIETLTRSNIGQIVLRAINQAKLKINERRIKLVIREMVESEDVVVVGIDALDELGETIGTVDIECDQIDEGLYPGEIIEVSIN